MALFGKKSDSTEKQKTGTRVRQTRARSHTAGVANEIVHAPWFSEKSLVVTERGVYTFSVPERATKADIAGAVKEIYKVTPKKVRIVNLPGKRKALRTRRGFGTRAGRRKAYVYLKKGETIQFA